MFEEKRGAASTPQEAYRYNQKYITPEGARKGQLPTVDDCRRELKKDPSQGIQGLRIRMHKAGWNMSGRAALVPLAELLIEQIIKDGQQPPMTADQYADSWSLTWQKLPAPKVCDDGDDAQTADGGLHTLPDDVHAPGTPRAHGDSDGAASTVEDARPLAGAADDHEADHTDDVPAAEETGSLAEDHEYDETDAADAARDTCPTNRQPSAATANLRRRLHSSPGRKMPAPTAAPMRNRYAASLRSFLSACGPVALGC